MVGGPVNPRLTRFLEDSIGSHRSTEITNFTEAICESPFSDRD